MSINNGHNLKRLLQMQPQGVGSSQMDINLKRNPQIPPTTKVSGFPLDNYHD